MVKAAFEAQRQFLMCVSRCKQPSQQILESVLKPTSQQISAIQVLTPVTSIQTRSSVLPRVPGQSSRGKVPLSLEIPKFPYNLV